MPHQVAAEDSCTGQLRTLIIAWLSVLVLWPGLASAEVRLGAFVSGGHLCDVVRGAPYAVYRAQHRAVGVSVSYLVDFVSFDRVGTYEPIDRIESDLECAWHEGVVPIVNWVRAPGIDMHQGHLSTLYPPHPGYVRIYAWANAFKRWIDQGEGRYLYVIPFPEHNASWTPYYDPNPEVFQDAFGMIAWIMAHYAGPSVRLGWGPWLMGGYGERWRAYDPTWYHTLTPSLYAGRACQGEFTLLSYTEAFLGPLNTLRLHGKPILLAQTGIVSADPDQKVRWAQDFYQRIIKEPGVVGVAWWNPADYPGCGFELPNWTDVLAPLDWRRR